MTYLPDVNVWVAFASDRHIHHPAAKSWFEGLGTEQIAFCRITELGFLRLLTNSRVMGEDVLEPADAWRVYDALRAAPQVIFLPEQTGFNDHWRQIGDKITGGPNTWTDAYLAAFAGHVSATVATFDRGFRGLGKCSIYNLIAGS